jgi:hypothetical protein
LLHEARPIQRDGFALTLNYNTFCLIACSCRGTQQVETRDTSPGNMRPVSLSLLTHTETGVLFQLLNIGNKKQVYHGNGFVMGSGACLQIFRRTLLYACMHILCLFLCGMHYFIVWIHRAYPEKGSRIAFLDVQDMRTNPRCFSAKSLYIVDFFLLFFKQLTGARPCIMCAKRTKAFYEPVRYIVEDSINISDGKVIQIVGSTHIY